MNEIEKFFVILVCFSLIFWVIDCWRKGRYDDSSNGDYFDGEP